MNPFVKIRIVKKLDKIAETKFGEFGFATLDFDDKWSILNEMYITLFDEEELLMDNDRIAQAIDARKERLVVLEMMNELKEF